jgi:hypothetical protein
MKLYKISCDFSFAALWLFDGRGKIGYYKKKGGAGYATALSPLRDAPDPGGTGLAMRKPPQF